MSAIPVGIISVQPVVQILIQFSAVAKTAKPLLFIAATSFNESPLCVPGVFGKDVNHAINRVGSP